MVTFGLSRSHVQDASTVARLDAITTKDERQGKTVTITGLDDPSLERHDRLGGHLGVGH